MYILKDHTRTDFIGIAVPNQKAIIEQIGSPLIPEQAFDLLKQQTENFTKSDPLAKEADAMLSELLKNNPKKEAPSSKSTETKILDQEAIQIRAAARERRIRILKLKYKTTQKSA